MFATATLMDIETAISEQKSFDLLGYVIISIILIMMLYNFFLFTLIRDRIYLFYALFSASVIITIASVVCLFEHTLSLRGLHLASHHKGTIVISVGFAMIFAAEFLSLRQLSAKLHRFMQAYAFANLAAGALDFANIISINSSAAALAMWVSSAIILIPAIYSLKSGFRPALFFLVAWVNVAVCNTIFAMAQLGILPLNLLTMWISPIGFCIELILMSFALAYRIRILEEMRTQYNFKTKESDHLRVLLHVLIHDLTNPLTVLRLLSEHTKLGIAPDPNYLKRVSRAIDSMVSILERVRKLEDIRVAHENHKLEDVDLQNVFATAEAIFLDRLKEKSIKLNLVKIPDNARFAIAETTTFTHDVINNLVSNAIKFTNIGGEIRLSATLVKDRVIVEVRDNGIGIPPEALAKIFDPKANQTRRGTQNEKGSGFGMPLVAAFMEQYGGSVAIDSSTDSENHGTCIRLSLQSKPEGSTATQIASQKL